LQLRPGRKPKLIGWKLTSKIGSSTNFTAVCRGCPERCVRRFL
jgi:hypothetical protein